MTARVPSLVLRDRPRSPLVGLLAAALAVAAVTLLIYPLKTVAPVVSTSVVYLLAVLLVSTYWGLWLGIAAAFGGGLAFNFFHLEPTGRLTIADAENWVALAVFLAAAIIASSVAELARSRAREAESRRAEADLAAELARVLLGGAAPLDALAVASQRLATALDVSSATLRLGEPAAAPGHTALGLELGRGRTATLELPGGLDAAAVERIRARIVPSLEALLGAALDRDALQAEVVETQALRRSDVVKTALLRAVSHDLRTPLTAIRAAGEALRSTRLEPEDRDELAAVIESEATRLAHLVDRLLDLSRLQSGTAEPRRDWLALDEVVRGAVEQLGAGPDVPVTISLDRDLPLIRADAVQLERVFVNLLENARRHAPGTPVQVRGRVSGGRLLVRVVDRGPGIPRERLERIFEPFYRGEEGGAAGAGLGLAIVRGFVEANGGRVWAESLPGQGTAFVLEFPPSALAGPAPAGAPAAAPGTAAPA